MPGSRIVSYIPGSTFKTDVPSTIPGDTYFVSKFETVYTWDITEIDIPGSIFKTAIPNTIPGDNYIWVYFQNCISSTIPGDN